LNKLKSICTNESLDSVLSLLESGRRPKGGVKNIPSGIPSIGGEHLDYNGQFKFDKIKFVPLEFYKKMSKAKILENDILIVKDGATTGKTSFVSKSFPYKKAAVNEHVFIARVNEKIIPKALFYFLFSPMGQQQLKKCITGSAQGGINRSILKNINIIYPSDKNLQQKIVNEIEKQFTRLDETIESLKITKQKLGFFRESVLDSTVFGKLANVGNKQTISSICMINPKRSELAQIKNDLEVSFLRMASVSVKGKVKSFELRKLSAVRNGYTYFKNNDILIAKITPCFENGKRAIVKNLKNGIGFGSTEFHVIRCNDPILPEWVFYILSGRAFRNLAKMNMTGAVGQKRVPKRIIENYPIFVPKKEIQQKLINNIESHFSVIDNLEKTIDSNLEKCELLRKSLLKNAFSDKLIKEGVSS
jgi:restriction endonuclease S subunit